MKNKNRTMILRLILITTWMLSACSSTFSSTLVGKTTSISSPTEITISQTSIQLSDGLSRQVVLATPTQRVVSLAPSNTEILFAIGAGPQVVGRDAFSDYPAEAENVTVVSGGFGELNTEVILAKKPDLILASSLTPPEQISALEELGLTVFALGNPIDFEGMYNNVLLVARMTGHEPEAKVLIGSLKMRVVAIEDKIALTEKRPLVFYELDGTDPSAPWTSGPGTFVDTLIYMAGGENLGHSLDGEWVQISIEELIRRNPDSILLGSAHWGGVTPEEVEARSGWDALDAIKNNNLFTFEDNLVSRPGPRLVEGLETMAKLLHPELFQ
jgi:iron complex transport system substrate-binding protein